VTICHATGSSTNPYVQITISENALPAHLAHQDGRDIIPAPANGCPGSYQQPPPCDTYWQDCNPGGPASDKTTICHATGSSTNPYVQLTISNSALDAHRAHQDRQDIIPAPASGCPQSVSNGTGPPATPGGLVVTSATKTSLTLSWQTPTGDVGGYDLFLDWAATGRQTTTTSATFSGLNCGDWYVLGVAAHDSSGGNQSGTAWLTGYTAAC
jgi:hypothetical protein